MKERSWRNGFLVLYAKCHLHLSPKGQQEQIERINSANKIVSHNKQQLLGKSKE